MTNALAFALVGMSLALAAAELTGAEMINIQSHAIVSPDTTTNDFDVLSLSGSLTGSKTGFRRI